MSLWRRGGRPLRGMKDCPQTFNMKHECLCVMSDLLASIFWFIIYRNQITWKYESSQPTFALCHHRVVMV